MCDLVDGTFWKKNIYNSTTIPPILIEEWPRSQWVFSAFTFKQTLFNLQVLDFLNLEATLVLNSEEEEYEEEDKPGNWYGLPFMAILIYFIGYLMGDDEPLSDDEMDTASLPGLPDV